MRQNIHLIILLLVFTYVEMIDARMRLVPDEYNTINFAVDAAVPGDTILIQPGVYVENLSLRKNIIIGSCYLTTNDTAYTDSTVISGDGAQSVVSIIGNYSPTFTGLTITNGGRSYGGAFYLHDNACPVIRRCTLTGNGSGVYCLEDSNPQIEDCRIINNNSYIGGDGICCHESPRPNILRCLIANNSGSGIYCRDGSNPEIVDCRIESNRSKGVFLYNSTPSIRNCVIINNRDETVGGIYLYMGSDAEVSGCTITGNIGEAYGGIACYQSNPRFNNCTISNNRGGSVGGIRIAINSSPRFRDCQITHNTGEGRWGVIRCDDSNPTFRNCVISDNVSANGCAGITLNGGDVSFDHCLIFDNRSRTNGGAFHCTQTSVIIVNCTFTRNTSGENGGVFYCEGGFVSILNSILWNNSSPSIYLRSVGDQVPERAGIIVNYSDMNNGIDNIVNRGEVDIDWTKTNITENPLFAEPGHDDFSLLEDSPCIDAGSPFTMRDRDATTTDMGAIFYPQANIAVYPEWLVFDSIRIGQNDRGAVTIHNIGLRLLSIDTMYIRPNPSFFSIDENNRTFSIQPGDEHEVWIDFQADEFGEQRSVLFIESNDRRRGRYTVFISGYALDVANNNIIMPKRFEITSVYPNPFNSETTISFTLSMPGWIIMDVIDIHGRSVISMPAKQWSNSEHSIVVSLDGFDAGVYFIRLRSSVGERLCKILLVK